MAHRFIRAQPRRDRLAELRRRLDDGEIEAMTPFGEAMSAALRRAKYDPTTGEAAWEEEDYCSPPLAMERAEVLDEYFTDIEVVADDGPVGHGWERVEHLPSLWEALGIEA